MDILNVAQCGQCGHNNTISMVKPEWLSVAVPYYKCSAPGCGYEYFTHEQSLLVDHLRVQQRRIGAVEALLRKQEFANSLLTVKQVADALEVEI